MKDSDVIVEIKNIENKKYYFLPFASIAATSLEKSFSNFNYSKTIEDYAREENCFILKYSTTFPEDFFFRFIVALEKKEQELIKNYDEVFDCNFPTSLLDFLPSNHCDFFPCINRSINSNIVAYLKFQNFRFIIPHLKNCKQIVIFVMNYENETNTVEIQTIIKNIVDKLFEKYYKIKFPALLEIELKQKNGIKVSKKIRFTNKIETYFNDNENVKLLSTVFLNFLSMWISSKFFQYSNVLDVFYEIIKNFLYDEAYLHLFEINNNKNFESIANNLKYFLEQPSLILEYNLKHNFDTNEKIEKKFGDEQEWRGKKINWKILKNNFNFFDEFCIKNFQKNVEIKVLLYLYSIFLKLFFIQSSIKAKN
jgi:hypothetical protein